MPVYTINYNAENSYEDSLFEAVLEFLILPAETFSQKVLEFNIECDPKTEYYFSKNLYEFDIIRCHLKIDIDRFKLKLKAKVEKQELNPFAVNWLPVNIEREILKSDDTLIDYYYYLKPGIYTTPVDNWKPLSITKNEQVFDFIQKVNELVHHSMVYDIEKASVNNTLEDILGGCTGVCQDYAHLMIAILRENKIPARYVSGYLNQGTNYEGSSAIHAWVEALIPGIGWMGFDPTNNLLEDHHYIKIAHGVDISECPSLKGVVRSNGNNTTNYEVFVRETQINIPEQ